jgi:glucokinase
MQRISRSQILALPRTDIAGIDAGGTKTHMRYVHPSDGSICCVQARSADYDSLEDLFYACFHNAGCLPRTLVAGVAGRPGRNGDVRITNHPQWPVFRRESFAEDLGVALTTVNDMAAAANGIDELAESEYELLTHGLVTSPDSSKLIVSVGTGVGSALIEPDGRVHSAESGHVSWQAVISLEEDYLRSLQRLHPGVPVSVEWSIGGLHGFDRMYDFMSSRKKPSPYIQEHVDRYRREHRGIGPVITSAAVGGDGCCREIMRLFGAILGQFIRNMVLTCLSQGGSVWLMSGVLQAPGVCEMLVDDTDFLARVVSTGAEHTDLLQRIPVYLITDRQVAVRGAYAMTRRLAESDA